MDEVLLAGSFPPENDAKSISHYSVSRYPSCSSLSFGMMRCNIGDQLECFSRVGDVCRCSLAVLRMNTKNLWSFRHAETYRLRCKESKYKGVGLDRGAISIVRLL